MGTELFVADGQTWELIVAFRSFANASTSYRRKFAFTSRFWTLKRADINNRFLTFYIRGSVHRNSRLKISNEMQQYADIYLLLNYSTCFGRPSRPSSGVHKTLVAACGTDRTIWEASFFKRDQIRSQIVWSVPEAATTVLCISDDGHDGRPKHVE